MAPPDVERMRGLWRFWLLSPERLWLTSISLHRSGHRRLAFWIKQLNTIMYHNSLAPGASVSPDVRLGHNSFGTIIHAQVTIGRRVRIWQHVMLFARPPGSPARVVVEDDVMIGANVMVVTPRGKPLTIGRGAQIGAGAVVTRDVPPGATVVCAPSRILMPDEAGAAGEDAGDALGGDAGSGVL